MAHTRVPYDEARSLATRLLPFAQTYENWAQYESAEEYIHDTADALFFADEEADAIACELECYSGPMWAQADVLREDIDRYLRAMRREGITADSNSAAAAAAGFHYQLRFADEPIFYNRDLMVYESLTEIRADYEQAALDLEEDDIFSLEDLIERETDMGGSIFSVDAFYAFCVDGLLDANYTDGDDDIETVIADADDYAHEHDVAHDSITICRVICPAYNF